MRNFNRPSLGKFMFGRITGRRNPNDIDYSFLLSAGLALLVVLTLWWTPFLFPFRIFTTTVHEASHAAVGILTGGKLKSNGAIQVFWNGGGVTYFYNVGFNLLTYSAGYVGSTLFGGFMLLRAKRASTRRQTLFFITVGLLVLTLLFVRDVQSILLIGIVVVLTGLVAWKAPDVVVTFYVFVMAILNATYALFDLVNLLFSSANPFEQFNGRSINDAVLLSDQTGIPAFIWAILWSAFSVWLLWRFVRLAIRVGTGEVQPRPGLFSGSGRRAATKTQSTLDRYNRLFK